MLRFFFEYIGMAKWGPRSSTQLLEWVNYTQWAKELLIDKISLKEGSNPHFHPTLRDFMQKILYKCQRSCCNLHLLHNIIQSQETIMRTNNFVRNIRHIQTKGEKYFAKYCQAHIILSWLWITLCNSINHVIFYDIGKRYNNLPLKYATWTCAICAYLVGRWVL